METEPAQKGDILGADEIAILVDRFYDAVRQDSLLGPVFDEVAQVNWETHIPKLCAFWETVLFRTGGYRGNPLEAHRSLMPRASFDQAMFQRWLDLFFSTVDANFQGENADHIRRVAEDMARVIHSRLHGLPPAFVARPPAAPQADAPVLSGRFPASRQLR